MAIHSDKQKTLSELVVDWLKILESITFLKDNLILLGFSSCKVDPDTSMSARVRGGSYPDFCLSLNLPVLINHTGWTNGKNHLLTNSSHLCYIFFAFWNGNKSLFGFCCFNVHLPSLSAIAPDSFVKVVLTTSLHIALPQAETGSWEYKGLVIWNVLRSTSRIS